MEYARLTSPEVELLDKDGSVIVIPVAAIEQHGPHLSLKTDTVLAEAVARRAAEKATANVLVTPAFWAGCSNHHMDFPGSLSLQQETFVRTLSEIALCFVRHGFKKLFFLNGHGHNLSPLQLVARNVRDATDGSVIAATGNYWHFIPDDIRRIRESPMGGMAHAGEFETSAMLAEAPDQVQMDRAVTHMPKWKTPFYYGFSGLPASLHRPPRLRLLSEWRVRRCQTRYRTEGRATPGCGGVEDRGIP